MSALENKLSGLNCSAQRCAQIAKLVAAGLLTEDRVEEVADLTDRAFRAYVDTIATSLLSAVTLTKAGKGRGDDDGEGVSEPELRKIAAREGCTVDELRKAMADRKATKRAAEHAGDEDPKSIKAKVLGGFGRAHAPSALDGSDNNHCRTSRDLQASIAPDDGADEAEKQTRVLRLANELAGGEPKRAAGLSTLGTERAGTIISTRRG